MGTKLSENGRLHVNKGRIVFVSSKIDCPKINSTLESNVVKFKDDFSQGFKVSKSLAKLIF